MTPKAKKIIAREGLFIFLLAMFSLILDSILVHLLNFIDKTSWHWYITAKSALRSIIMFIIVGYVIRLIIWVVKTLRAK